MKTRDIGPVELTDSKLLVSTLPPRARSTPPLRGMTWQQGPEADLAGITVRRKQARVAHTHQVCPGRRVTVVEAEVVLLPRES